MPAQKISPEHILDVLQGYLQTALEQNIIRLVSSGRGQARNDSSANEALIGASLRGFALGHPLFSQQGMVFEVATNGRWYDFLVYSLDGQIWMPINLKVSTLKGNDNLSSKEGLYFALTGKNPSGGVIRNWELFCSNLAANVCRMDNSADYYYLVVQKPTANQPMGRVFWTSLLKLQRVTPNGSNPPFQCKWQENVERASRSRQEAVDRLLDVLGETFVLRANALNSFQRHIVPGFTGPLKAKWEGDPPIVVADEEEVEQE